MTTRSLVLGLSFLAILAWGAIKLATSSASETTVTHVNANAQECPLTRFFRGAR